VNLHVFQVRLKQRKVSSLPPSLQGSNGGNMDAGKVRKFPHFQNQRGINSYYVLLQYIISKEWDKMYRGFYFLYRYGDFTLYFLSRSFAVRERNAGYCEKRPDSIT
jgi:hypothetical protein